MKTCACCGDSISRKNAYGYCSRTPECRTRYQRAWQDARRPPTTPKGEPCKSCGIPTTSKYGYCKRATCLEAREQVRSRTNYKPDMPRRHCIACGSYLSLKAHPYIAVCTKCDGSRVLNRNRLLKAQVMRAYGGVCACCGEDNLDFLTIDHVQGDGAEERRDRNGGANFYRWLAARNYPDLARYQVLCFNCNCAKSTKAECPCKSRRFSVSDVFLPGQLALF